MCCKNVVFEKGEDVHVRRNELSLIITRLFPNSYVSRTECEQFNTRLSITLQITTNFLRRYTSSNNIKPIETFPNESKKILIYKLSRIPFRNRLQFRYKYMRRLLFFFFFLAVKYVSNDKWSVMHVTKTHMYPPTRLQIRAVGFSPAYKR